MTMRHHPATRAGSPFSRAVNAGGIVALSGQIGNDASGKLAADLAGQTRQTMENIGAILTSIDLDFSAVFKCTIMLADMGQWHAFNPVYLSYFDPERLPARSAFGASGLVSGALVEIECWAYAPD